MEIEILSNMKVAELRAESKNRGLTLESKGKKFTKQELIDRIVEFDRTHAEVEIGNNNETAETESVSESESIVVKAVTTETTLEQIIDKYSKPKNEYFYNEMLKPQKCIVVFVHYIETKSGELIKKLRTAKVVAVNRTKKKVRVETLLGTEVELNFSDILFMKQMNGDRRFPKDIRMFLKSQRTEKGQKLVDEMKGDNNGEETTGAVEQSC